MNTRILNWKMENGFMLTGNINYQKHIIKINKNTTQLVS